MTCKEEFNWTMFTNTSSNTIELVLVFSLLSETEVWNLFILEQKRVYSHDIIFILNLTGPCAETRAHTQLN